MIKSQCDGGCSNIETIKDENGHIRIIEVEYFRETFTSNVRVHRLKKEWAEAFENL